MRKIQFRKIILLFLIFTMAMFYTFCSIASSKEHRNVKEETNQAPGREKAILSTKSKNLWSTTDHFNHKSLHKNFKSGKEVTDECIHCHNKAAEQFKKTIHWTWIKPDSNKENQAGKAGFSINNFCISTNMANDKSCLGCHPGWNNERESVNCLDCHGQKDFNLREAFDDIKSFLDEGDSESIEIAKEIQKEVIDAVCTIAKPTRKNCGSCHFKGGGGDGVKHGDLDSSMTNPGKELDVHMGSDGQNFQCTRCHTTVLHNIAGRVYKTPAAEHRKSLVDDDMISKIMCESCHSNKPHKWKHKANDHTDKVACQSCHIPEFARKNPTKIWWDWSKAGKTKDGKKYTDYGQWHKPIYKSIKGEFKWAKNVVPEYFWFNGSINTLTFKDIIDPDKTVKVSWPTGNRKDKNSRIFPFKVHRGKTPYDKVNKTMLAPLLSEPEGFWKTLDWDDAVDKGMRAINQPFSGKIGFVNTTYVMPTTHMVTPVRNALKCMDCHIKNGRLAKLEGFYMPGRDRFKLLTMAGWGIIAASIVGIFLHALVRFFISTRKKEL